MATIGFPLTITQLAEMRKDGDKISLYFSCSSIVSLVLFFIFLAIYYFTLEKVFEAASVICLPLAAVCLAVVYFYRPYFLVSEKRRWRMLDKLEGEAHEEALKKLTEDEMERYLLDSSTINTSWIKRFFQ